MRELLPALGISVDEADEILQEVWVSALLEPPGRVASLRGWLRSVAAHAWIRGRRRDRARAAREKRVARPDLAPSPFDELAQRSVREFLARMVAELKPPYREAVHARYIDELSVEDVARRLGRTPGTVRVQLSRGLELLRERLRPVARKGALWSLAPALGLRRGRRAPSPAALARVPGSIGLAAGAVAVLAGSLLLRRADSRPELGASPVLAALVEHGPAPRPEPVAAAGGRTALRPPLRERGASALLVRAERASDGAPLGGLPLFVAALDEHHGTLRARTETDGSVRLSGIAPGRWRIAPLRGDAVEVEVAPGEEAAARLLVPAGITVQGSVAPLAPAMAESRIWVSYPFEPDRGERLVAPDASGRYRIEDVDPESWICAVHARWGSSMPFLVKTLPRTSGIAEANLSLSRASLEARAGRVLDAAGSPVAGAVVSSDHGPAEPPWWKSGLGFQRRPAPPLAVTDEGGSFELPFFGEDRDHWIVRAPGLAAWRATRSGNGLDPWSIRLPRPASLRAAVLSSDGTPAARARVRCVAQGFELPPVETDGRGRFELAGLLPGTFTLTAIAAGSEPEGCVLGGTIEEGRDLDLEVRLGTSSTIRGRLSRAAGPVADLRVELEPERAAQGRRELALGIAPGAFRSTTTSREGTFAFAGLSPGPVRLRLVTKEGRVIASRTSRAPDDFVWDCDAPGPASVTGFVGDPVCASLFLESPALSGPLPVVTEPSGRFWIDALPPDRFSLVALFPVAGPTVLARFELPPGGALDLGHLRLIQPVPVQIDVVAPAKVPAAKMRVRLQDPLTRRQLTESSKSWNAERKCWSFLFDAVPPGAYSLLLHPGRTDEGQLLAEIHRTLRVREGEPLSLELTAAPGQLVRFELEDPPEAEADLLVRLDGSEGTQAFWVSPGAGSDAGGSGFSLVLGAGPSKVEVETPTGERYLGKLRVDPSAGSDVLLARLPRE